MGLFERRILLIGLVVFILLGLFAWFVLYQPRLQSRHRSVAKIANLTKELKATRERVKGIGRLRQRLVGLEEAKTAFEARIIPRSGMLTMLQRLAKLAQDKKVRFLEISPPGLDTLLQEETVSKPVRAVPFYVTVQGRYVDVGRYVESLGRFPYFVRVPDFEIIAREDIRPEVEVKLLVDLYTSSLAAGRQL
ncbi:hypothetical protein CH330_06105 [candidate division WOR-3 bacterium JGI_Cruoil_03_51_56]|uniref:Pilus assembly protein PilO n=1 Tax=candidate division WOR-3 bacterium JGI_Cruoil_03_51_56 TaxID=1973747 RepID=A0A235BU64_UNCW3|nr:MAG: hypothetical protein CH330_06105 [candidate division WOR-3 bacterium JGI_Cruoil_03_51_56]